MSRFEDYKKDKDNKPPTVSVGKQSGVIVAGVAGEATFALTTANIADGTYQATVSNRPPGVSVAGDVEINAGKGTLTIAGNSSTLTIDEAPAGTLQNITVSLVAGDGKITLAPQTAADGYAFYYTHSGARLRSAHIVHHRNNSLHDGNRNHRRQRNGYLRAGVQGSRRRQYDSRFRTGQRNAGSGSDGTFRRRWNIRHTPYLITITSTCKPFEAQGKSIMGVNMSALTVFLTTSIFNSYF